MFRMKRSILLISTLLILVVTTAATYFTLTTMGVVNAGKVELTIKLDDNEKIYDGKPLSGGTYEITNGSIANTHQLEVTYTSSITNVGQTELTATARVVDENNADVTKKIY